MIECKKCWYFNPFRPDYISAYCKHPNCFEKIKEQDRNSVKGQCPIEYELFWRLDENVLPRQMIFSLKTEANNDNDRINGGAEHTKEV